MKSFFLAFSVMLAALAPAVQAQSVQDLLLFNGSIDYALPANVDESSSPAYYGFENQDGGWIIIKKSTSASIDTFTYAKGSSAYSTAWTGRAGLTYAAASTTW